MDVSIQTPMTENYATKKSKEKKIIINLGKRGKSDLITKIFVLLLFPFSGVTLAVVSALGLIETAWHVMTGTHVHVQIRVAAASAQLHLSNATRFASTVMATVAV